MKRWRRHEKNMMVLRSCFKHERYSGGVETPRRSGSSDYLGPDLKLTPTRRGISPTSHEH